MSSCIKCGKQVSCGCQLHEGMCLDCYYKSKQQSTKVVTLTTEQRHDKTRYLIETIKNKSDDTIISKGYSKE